jgi:hypothetical protein
MTHDFGVVLKPPPCTANNDESSFSFLSLPSELRNQIYEIVCCKNAADSCEYLQIGQHPARGLVRACRQIYDETKRLFDASAIFMFRPIDAAGRNVWPIEFGRKYERFIDSFPSAGVANVGIKLGRCDFDAVDRILRWGPVLEVLDVRYRTYSRSSHDPFTNLRTILLQLCTCPLGPVDPSINAYQIMLENRNRLFQILHDYVEYMALLYPTLDRIVVYHCPYRPRKVASEPGSAGMTPDGLNGNDDDFASWMLEDRDREDEWHAWGPLINGWLNFGRTRARPASDYIWERPSVSSQTNVLRVRAGDASSGKKASELMVEFHDSQTVCGRRCTEHVENKEDFQKALEFCEAKGRNQVLRG